MRLELRMLACALGWSIIASASYAAHQDVTKIAFGSCAREDLPQPIWHAIVDKTPDAFLMLGDNIYGDTSSVRELRRKYDKLAAKPEFQTAREAMPFFATWDDHDYGQNDGGAEYSQKVASQQAFLDFWQVAAHSPRRAQKGVYNSAFLGSDGQRVQIIMLDTRYFRSPLKKEQGVYVPDWDPASTMLGAEQWRWLEGELKKPADVRIIASSIQFASSEHHFEKWENFPHERQRLLDLIADTKARGVILVSGDRHFAEISRIPATQKLYPIYDITASALNIPGRPASETNSYRIAPKTPYNGVNFGMITILWDGLHGPQIEIEIRDENGEAVTREYVPLIDLRFDATVAE